VPEMRFRCLPCDATQTSESAVMPQLVVLLSVCHSVRLSVMFTYVFHTGWNTSKMTLRIIILRFVLGLTTTSAIYIGLPYIFQRVELLAYIFAADSIDLFYYVSRMQLSLKAEFKSAGKKTEFDMEYEVTQGHWSLCNHLQASN